MSRRLVSASVAAVVFVSGCTGNQQPAAKPADKQSLSATQSPSAPNQVSPFDPAQLPRNNPEALAAATEHYAQIVQQIPPKTETSLKTVSAENLTAPAPVPPQPDLGFHTPFTPDLSVLKWLETETFALPAFPNQESHTASTPEADSTTTPTGISIHIAGPAPVSSVPAPAPTVTPVTQDPVAILEQDLAQRLKDKPKDLSAHLDYQLLQLVRGKPVPQLDVVSSLDAEDRQVLSAVLDAMTNFRGNVRGNPNMLMAKKVQPLMEMQDRLGGANLRVSNLALCRKVDGFGIYDKLTTDRLDPGRSQPVIVYCEVENFTSQYSSDRKLWETSLSEEITVYDATGQRVWIDRRQSTTDACRTRRRDFSLAKMIRLPALAPGRYTITVSIQDEQAQKIAEASLPFVAATEEQARR